jgi:hypothetical protein
MTIDELYQIKVNKAVAYIVGLIFPLYKNVMFDGKDCIAGCVNHNSNMITPTELASHYNSVYNLINSEIGIDNVVLVANKNEINNVSPKEGFSVLIDKTGKTDKYCLDVLTNITNNILKESSDIRKEFVKGCFDGRSSWDTTAHYLSIDVDRDYSRQDLIEKVILLEGIKVNINRRELNHPKNDQIRIKVDSIKKFISNIGLYSTCRLTLVNHGISKLK